eukprot:COSAG06_NODE_30315_length_526_cov_0.640271_1_plen_76_part_10
MGVAAARATIANQLATEAGRAHGTCERSVTETCKAHSGEVSRPDLAACIASGLFDLCLEAITAVAAEGVDSLQDTH